MPCRLRKAVAASVRRQMGEEHIVPVCLVFAADDDKDEEAARDALSHPCSMRTADLRALRTNLGHPKNIHVRHLHHAHASKRARQGAIRFDCPAFNIATLQGVARQSAPAEVRPSTQQCHRCQRNAWLDCRRTRKDVAS